MREESIGDGRLAVLALDRFGIREGLVNLQEKTLKNWIDGCVLECVGVGLALVGSPASGGQRHWTGEY